MCLALPRWKLLLAVAAVVWWPHACASLQWRHFGGTQSRGLALLHNHCVTNSPSSIMELGEAVCHSPAWKAEGRQALVRHYIKNIPKREPRLRRKGPPPKRLTLSASGSRGTLKEYTQQQGEGAATWKCLFYLKFKSYFQSGFPLKNIFTFRQFKYLFALKSFSLHINMVCTLLLIIRFWV